MNLRTHSPEEAWRLYRRLDITHVEKLLDGQANLEHSEAALAHIDEAKCQFPSDDFLQNAIDTVTALIEQLPDENKASAEELLGELEKIQTETWKSAELGLAELVKAENLLEGA